MNITQVPIQLLKFADYNPRKITEKQVEDLKASVEKFGLVEPVVVNSHPDRNNIIVGGHQRVRIMKLLDYKEVPVVYVKLDEHAEKELNIRLNKNGGEFDWDMLANNFNNEDLMVWGFSEGELGIGGDDRDLIDTDNLGSSLDSYLDGNIRQVVLYFKKDEYETTIPRLEAAMQNFGVENHTEVLLKLLDEYETSRTASKEPGL